MLFSSTSPFHPTISSLHVQPTIPNDVQSLHSYDAVDSFSMLPVNATSSDASGPGTIHTMLPDSTLSYYSVATDDLTYIHGPSLTTTSQPSLITYSFYQGIWF